MSMINRNFFLISFYFLCNNHINFDISSIEFEMNQENDALDNVDSNNVENISEEQITVNDTSSATTNDEDGECDDDDNDENEIENEIFDSEPDDGDNNKKPNNKNAVQIYCCKYCGMKYTSFRWRDKHMQLHG